MQYMYEFWLFHMKIMVNRDAVCFWNLQPVLHIITLCKLFELFLASKIFHALICKLVPLHLYQLLLTHVTE